MNRQKAGISGEFGSSTGISEATALSRFGDHALFTGAKNTCAEIAERIAQSFILDAIDQAGKPFILPARQRAPWRRLAFLRLSHRLLHDTDPPHGGKPQKRIDAADHLPRLMLKAKGGSPLAGNHQRSGFERIVLMHATRPGQLFGPRASCKAVAHDLGPALHQFHRNARTLAHHRIENTGDKVAHRDGIAPVFVPCHEGPRPDFNHERLRATMARQSAPVIDAHASFDDFSMLLLAWYDRHHRHLPWRTPPADTRVGVLPDPYRVWLSEVMLQQTTVSAVKSYYEAFLATWPTVEALADAETEAVMRAWAGLGYYSRARNLKKCAETVATEHEGRFPDTEQGLKALPGIGDYTAAAITAIAFNRPAVVVDGNVERVVTRLLAMETPLPDAKPLIRAFVADVLPADRPGDFAQAMMDLGATICTPRNPACALCPVSTDCLARQNGSAERFPRKAPKVDKPLRRGAAFVARRSDGAVFLRKRPPEGLLGGMTEMPTTGWSARQDGKTDASAAPFPADWRACGTIRHVFTHFTLELSVYRAEIQGLGQGFGKTSGQSPEGWWSPPEELPGEALPTVIKKAIEAAIPGATRKRQRDRKPS